MEIEIYSDVVCPWCYLGKRRLDMALASYPGEVTLRWRAFQLDPGAPRPGRPLLDWLGPKFGGIDRARREMDRVRAVAAAEGLDLDFDRAIIANTFDAHRLLWFADQPLAVRFGAFADTQPELAERLHRAHFVDGSDLSSAEVLVTLAEEVGLEPARVRELLDSTEGTPEVRAQLATAHELGITGVPTMIVEGKYAISGAQDAASVRDALGQIAHREGLGPTVPSGQVNSTVPGQRRTPVHDEQSRDVTGGR